MQDTRLRHLRCLQNQRSELSGHCSSCLLCSIWVSPEVQVQHCSVAWDSQHLSWVSSYSTKTSNWMPSRPKRPRNLQRCFKQLKPSLLFSCTYKNEETILQLVINKQPRHQVTHHLSRFLKRSHCIKRSWTTIICISRDTENHHISRNNWQCGCKLQDHPFYSEAKILHG